MIEIKTYQKIFLDYLKVYTIERHPKHLYNPINYILNLDGKRLRPALTLMTADIFGSNIEAALNAALSVEVFHNFSLVHDDIMDDAPKRRGKQTVHQKWNLNTGILSGDAMLILAYKLLENYPLTTFNSLAKLFSKTALKVCEGQQYDIDFETRNDVTIDEYLKMIEYKTAVLVGASMKMGAIVANTSADNQNAVYDFGRYLGIAFQLQDDYLDAFGNSDAFGKQIGGDIIENKKTYLFLKAVELLNDTQKTDILKWYNLQPNDPTDKIKAVKTYFEVSGAKAATAEAVTYYTDKALEILQQLDINETHKKNLKTFGIGLMTRTI